MLYSNSVCVDAYKPSVLHYREDQIDLSSKPDMQANHTCRPTIHAGLQHVVLPTTTVTCTHTCMDGSLGRKKSTTVRKPVHVSDIVMYIYNVLYLLNIKNE